MEAIQIPDSGTSEGKDTLDAVRDTAHESGPDVRVGGQPASNADFVDAVYGSFPLMIALITITTFILLARAFRSLLLPLKAIVLNILSVAAAWGVLVLVWQHGYGSEAIFGIEATGSIPSWMPLMIFAFLFGLSMDYEVFILSRMREEYDRTGSTETAVVRGIARTGRLVTSAALILFLAFTAMASGPGTDLKMMATGPRGGDPARRDGDPRVDRARRDRADGPLELVAAGVAGKAAARGAVDPAGLRHADRLSLGSGAPVGLARVDPMGTPTRRFHIPSALRRSSSRLDVETVQRLLAERRAARGCPPPGRPGRAAAGVAASRARRGARAGYRSSRATCRSCSPAPEYERRPASVWRTG